MKSARRRIDRTTTIRASVRDIEITMLISISLVILVVFVFLRSARATLIPGDRRAGLADRHLRRHVPARLQHRQPSLMALTIATGFVVDDAIVVIENITRHLEAGMTPMQATLLGRPGNRLHGRLHQHLADRRLHSHPAHGRHRGPPVPRVRRHPFGGHPHLAGGLADHHADDVRAPAASRRRAAPRLALSPERARLRRHPALLRAHARAGCCATSRHPAGDAVHHRADDLPLRDRAQGLLPAAGYRAPSGTIHGRSGDLLPGHGQSCFSQFVRYRARRIRTSPS